jgi:hypothetical protein
MRRFASALVLLVVPSHIVPVVRHGRLPAKPTPITIHEWGTFTTVAGADGRAVEWLPLSGPADLPCFVHRFVRGGLKGLPAMAPRPLDYDAARASLVGRVRMETPVLYFYAPRPLTVDVEVAFPRGLMTEWYPAATVRQPIVTQSVLRAPHQSTRIRWENVQLAPNATPALPRDVPTSHYYAARATDATPLVVDGQQEKFLFYRGVADFDVPLSAVALPDGRIRVNRAGPDPLPAVVVFENRNGVMRYHVHGPLDGEATIALTPAAGEFGALRRDLEGMLTNAGLFAKEAAAMIETWRDTWFEEGTRLFYLMPASRIDAMLPLTVTSAAPRVVRVFVGRVDLVTPALLQSVEQAIDRRDAALLARHGRLLGPITDRLLAIRGERAAAAIRDARDSALAALLARATPCE